LLPGGFYKGPQKTAQSLVVQMMGK